MQSFVVELVPRAAGRQDKEARLLRGSYLFEEETLAAAMSAWHECGRWSPSGDGTCSRAVTRDPIVTVGLAALLPSSEHVYHFVSSLCKGFQ